MAKKTKQEAQQERLSLAEKRNRQERRNKKSRKEREQEKRRKKQERDRRKQKNIPTTAQQSIPYIRMLQDGICQVTKTFFSKTIQFYDINYQLALNEDKTTIFENYCDFLNYFDSSISVQLSFINQQVDVAEFEKSIDIPDQNDDFNAIREEYRTMLKNQLSKGNIAAILYCIPNKPAWICFTDNELKIIGELATKYDVIVLEDLAYFAMDFRRDLSVPGKAPFQPSVGKYTDNYIVMISGSKLFSYAGQRLGIMCISDALYNRKYDNLHNRFGGMGTLGYTIVNRIIYTLSSGTTHSCQYAMAAILKAANEGRINILDGVREYAERAHAMKELFTKYGFEIVYDRDLEEPIADGFYFTIIYPGFSGGDLTKEILYYGISAIPLRDTGSKKQGLRACVSQTGLNRMPELEERLKRFAADHTK